MTKVTGLQSQEKEVEYGPRYLKTAGPIRRMFSKIIQILLGTTPVAPALVTFWFKKSEHLLDGVFWLVGAIILFILLGLIIRVAKKKLEKLPISISEVSPADNKSIVFIFIYIIPLLGIDVSAMLVLLILFLITTNTHHFNPLLGLLGYHQYEIKLKEGTTFILITKRTLASAKQVKNVVQLTDYILLES